MNADGSISADMRRKLNQVNHLVELFRPVLAEIARDTRTHPRPRRELRQLLPRVPPHHHAARVARGAARAGRRSTGAPSASRPCRSRRGALGLLRDDLRRRRRSAEADVAAAVRPAACRSTGATPPPTTPSSAASRSGSPTSTSFPAARRRSGRSSARTAASAPSCTTGSSPADFAATLTDVIRAVWLADAGLSRRNRRVRPARALAQEPPHPGEVHAAPERRRRGRARRALAELTAPPAIIESTLMTFHPGHDALHGFTVVLFSDGPSTWVGRWQEEQERHHPPGRRLRAQATATADSRRRRSSPSSPEPDPARPIGILGVPRRK